MKFFLALISALVLCNIANAAHIKAPQPSRSEVLTLLKSQANDVVDAVVDLLKKYANEHSLEPMTIPDFEQDFSVEILGLTVDGLLVLRNGHLAHLTTISRSGEATLEFQEDNQVHIVTEVQFNDLLLDYDYDVTVLGMNPTGALNGIAQGLRLKVDLTADLDTYTTTLGGLTVTNAAQIVLEVDGNGAADEIVNAIVKLVEPYFEKDILGLVEDKMRTYLALALVDFDIREILGL